MGAAPARGRRWPAPAKINLFLHIIGRREDGYHELQTLFQFLDLCDELEFAVREDGHIRMLEATPGVDPERDLSWRAAKCLQAASGTRLGADIQVHKRIPMGAGLGGGSSDGATTLVALSRLWGLDLPRPALAELGLELGADVPVFVIGRAAWAEGVGEVLTPVELAVPWYLVIVPGCEVPTGEVFAAATLTRNTAPTTITDCLGEAASITHRGAEIDSILERTRNDCEALVRGRYPAVDEALRWLSQTGVARMTGTGAGLFAPLGCERDARAWLERVPLPWRGFVARGLNESPLGS